MDKWANRWMDGQTVTFTHTNTYTTLRQTDRQLSHKHSHNTKTNIHMKGHTDEWREEQTKVDLEKTHLRTIYSHRQLENYKHRQTNKHRS